MMRLKNKYANLLYGLLMVAAIKTENAAAEDLTSIKVQGSACENLKRGETLSTARVRATDAASFNAVSKLDSLKQYKEELDSHDFNVMVYNIVDNYLEDLNVSTQEQNEEKICIEVSGYVSQSHVEQGIDESFNRQTQETELVDETAENAADLSAAVTEELNKATDRFEQQQEKMLEEKEIVYEDKPEEQAIITPPPPVALEQKIGPQTEVKPEQPQPLAEEKAIRQEGLIFVAPTEFFNQTSSDYYSAIIKNWFVDKKGFLITSDSKLADFILRPKILRAKVETVNEESNRLQMVTALELVYAASGKSYTEHQNRFVVYGNDEGEQDVAYRLMKQLLEKSCEELITGMEKYVEAKAPKTTSPQALPPIITPAKIQYPTVGD